MAGEYCELDDFHVNKLVNENRYGNIFTTTTTGKTSELRDYQSKLNTTQHFQNEQRNAREIIHVDGKQMHYKTYPSAPPPYGTINTSSDQLLPVRRSKCNKWLIVGIVVAILLSLIAISVTLAMKYTGTIKDDGSTPAVHRSTSPIHGSTPPMLPLPTMTSNPSKTTSTARPDERTSALPTKTTSLPASPTVPFEGQWSIWATWSDCDRTCGSGTIIRSRSCLAEPCIGVYTQLESCFTEACPSLADLYGVWTTWGPWESCSETCGNGAQSRNRVCRKEPDQNGCIGAAAMTRGCNEGTCPDCSINCTNGSIDCMKCSCTGTTISGKVLTVEGAPLQYVQVAYDNFEHTPLAITGEIGSFSLSDICLEDNIRFWKDGYVAKVVAISSSDETVRLSPIDYLHMTKEPRSAARFVGGCVHLECEATGSPGPAYYEWFQDDILVVGAIGQNLTLTEISKAEAGNYRCRASNDYTAVYSREVAVTVEETESEICEAIPRSYFVQLPYGCEINGENQIDIGTCTPKKCALEHSSSCEAPPTSECGATRYIAQSVQCTHYVLPVNVVGECGCRLSAETKRYLYGEVVSKDSHNAVYFADITINGDTAIQADFSGNFEFEIPPDVGRITVSINHFENTFSTFTTTLTLTEGSVNIYKTFYMKPKPDPVIFSSADGAQLNLTSSGNSEPLADIIIPPNAFYDSSGNIYNGEVQGYIDFIDSRDPDALDDAPGDFTAINSEGDPELLASNGMFKLDFTDTVGNKLNIASNISVSVTQSVEDLETAEKMKLWTLNADGRWEFLSDLTIEDSGDDTTIRRKRQSWWWFLVRSRARISSLSTITRWTNFDRIMSTTCLSKIRIYNDDALQTLYKGNVAIDIKTTQGLGSTINTISSVRPVGDPGYGSYCIVHPCDTRRSTTFYTFRGSITVQDKTDNELLYPVSNSGFISDYNFAINSNKMNTDFNQRVSNNGPFYDYKGKWNKSPDCVGAPTSHRSFQFYKEESKNCTSTETTIKPDFDFNDPRLYFYSSEHHTSRTGTEVCFMRIKVTTNFDQVFLTASSYTEHADNPPITENMYGNRQVCVNGTQYACVEYKAPGNVYQTASQTTNEKTRVIILMESDYDFTTVQSNIKGHAYTINDNTVDVMLEYDTTKEGFTGRFCEHYTGTLTNVKDRVRKDCNESKDPNYHALHFT